MTVPRANIMNICYRYLNIVYFSNSNIEYIHSMAIFTDLFKINRILCFAYKMKSFSRIDLPFRGNHICEIHGVPCNFGKDIFNIKDVWLIFQKDPFFKCKSRNSAFSLNVFLTNGTETQR